MLSAVLDSCFDDVGATPEEERLLSRHRESGGKLAKEFRLAQPAKKRMKAR